MRMRMHAARREDAVRMLAAQQPLGDGDEDEDDLGYR